MSIPAQGAVGAETMTADEVEALARKLHGANPGGPLVGWDKLWEQVRENYRTMARAALASPRADSDGRTAGEDLNDRLRAAGMFTIPEMMGETPLTRWEVHAAMKSLDAFGWWLDAQVRQYLTMKAEYDLSGGPEGDELYEWVLAHAAAFRTIRVNFEAARKATPAQPAGAVPDSLRALSEAATPGPWMMVVGDDYYVESESYPPHPTHSPVVVDGGNWIAVGNRPDDFGKANAELIVAAVNRLRDEIASHPAGQSAGSGAGTDALVDRFALALKAKLRAAEAKYGWQSGWLKTNWQAECQQGLVRHVGKGDPLDVAAYAAFCWYHGWPTTSRRSTELVTGAVIPTAGAIAAYAARYPDGSLQESSDDAIERWNRVAVAACLAEMPAPDSTRTGDEGTDWVLVPAKPTEEMIYAGRWLMDCGSDAAAASVYEAMLAARPAAPEAQGAWRSKAADEIDAIADLWSGDGRSYAKTIAAILRAEEPEQLPPADAETKRQVQRSWDRFKAGTSAPPASSGQGGR